MTTVGTLAFLLGTWDIARTIEDHHRGIIGSLVGRAEVRVIPAGRDGVVRQASYTEHGVLRHGDYQGEARRQLRLTEANKSTVMLFFANGRPFADLDLSAGTWESIHLCGPDRYEITTIVLSHDLVHERWKVRGPRKNYDAATNLKRLDER